MVRFIMNVLALGLMAASSAWTQPLVSEAFAREVTLNGVADPGVGATVIILDLSYAVETKIGVGRVARNGEFAAVVKPALIEGHRLVAVDVRGRRGTPFTVLPARHTPGLPPPPRK